MTPMPYIEGTDPRIMSDPYVTARDLRDRRKRARAARIAEAARRRYHRYDGRVR